MSKLWSIIAFSLLLGCDRRSGNPISSSRELPLVRVVRVERRPQNTIHELIGRTESRQSSILRFEVAGQINQVLVDVGDTVEKDSQIATIEDEDYRLAVQVSQAQVEAATSRLNLLQAGTRQEDIDIAKNEYQAALATTKYHLTEFKRKDELFKSKKASTQSERDLQLMLYASNAKKLEAAKARYLRAKAGPRIQEIDEAAADVQLQTERFNLANRDLKKTILRAPFRGRIEQRFVDVGSLTHDFPRGPIPIVLLVDTEELDAVFAVPEQFRGQLQPGDTVNVRTASNGDIESDVPIMAIGEVADSGTGTYELRVQLKNEDHRFFANSVVILKHEVKDDGTQLMIPTSAIRRSYNSPPYVLIVSKDQTLEMREVSINVRGPDCEVMAGLSEDELVVNGGGYRAVPGETVQTQTTELPDDQ